MTPPGRHDVATRMTAFGAVLAAAMVVGAGIGFTGSPEAIKPDTSAPAPMGQGVVATRDG